MLRDTGSGMFLQPCSWHKLPFTTVALLIGLPVALLIGLPLLASSLPFSAILTHTVSLIVGILLNRKWTSTEVHKSAGTIDQPGGDLSALTLADRRSLFNRSIDRTSYVLQSKFMSRDQAFLGFHQHKDADASVGTLQDKHFCARKESLLQVLIEQRQRTARLVEGCGSCACPHLTHPAVSAPYCR